MGMFVAKILRNLKLFKWYIVGLYVGLYGGFGFGFGAHEQNCR